MLSIMAKGLVAKVIKWTCARKDFWKMGLIEKRIKTNSSLTRDPGVILALEEWDSTWVFLYNKRGDRFLSGRRFTPLVR